MKLFRVPRDNARRCWTSSWHMARVDDGAGGMIRSPIAHLGTHWNPFFSVLPFTGLVNSGLDASMRGKKWSLKSLFVGGEAVLEILLGPGCPSQPRCHPHPPFRAEPSGAQGQAQFPPAACSRHLLLPGLSSMFAKPPAPVCTNTATRLLLASLPTQTFPFAKFPDVEGDHVVY